MAILSNINGKFAVDSTGAVQFSGAAGNSGYILKSNGTGSAPTWVDPDTVVGPYLPLSGGTLTGATATASGISFTFGGTAQFDGDMTLPAAADNFDIGFNLSTTGKIRFGNTAWNNSLGLESYWMVLRTNQNEGLKLIDSSGNTYVQLNASNNSAGAYNSIFTGKIGVGGKIPTYGLTLAQGTGVNNKIAWTDGTPSFRASIWANSSDDKFKIATGNASSVETVALEIDNAQNTSFGGNISTGGVVYSGPSSTNGGRAFAQNYSNPHYLGVVSSQYSSGAMVIGYGAQGKAGGGGFTSTYSNFSGGHSALQIKGDAFEFKLDGSNSQTAIGSDLTLNDRFTINRSGIGINNINPSANLDINVGGGSAALMTRHTNGLALFNEIAGGYSYLYLYQIGGGAKIVFSTNGNSYFNGGNLGIGTTSPDRSLDVEGTGMAIFGTGNYTELMLRGQVEGTGTVRNVGAFHWSIRADVGGDNDDLKLLRFITGSYAGIAMQVQNSTGDIFFGNTVVNPASGFSNQKGFGYDNSTGNLQVASTSGTAMTIGRNESSDGQILELRKESNIKHSFGSTTSYLLGNVGIGVTNPSGALHVYSGTSERFLITGDVHVQGSTDLNINGTNRRINFTSGNGTVRTTGVGSVIFATNSTERMRILSSGYIGMNEIPSGFATLEIKNISSTTYSLYADYTDTNGSYGVMKVILTGASTSPSYVDWWYGATQTGAVVTTGSSTQYLTSSDYRLKENIVPMSNAIDRVKQLKPSRFNFIGHENIVDGLIAHEVAEVVPEAVNGEKDGLRDDGTPKYQGIDEGKLVPLLIGAIQELEARVKELENK